MTDYSLIEQLFVILVGLLGYSCGSIVTPLVVGLIVYKLKQAQDRLKQGQVTLARKRLTTNKRPPPGNSQRPPQRTQKVKRPVETDKVIKL